MILAGDIGGTNARLALFDGAKGKPIAARKFESRAYPSLEAVADEFLGETGARGKVDRATFGLAGPVIDRKCVATNLPWIVDARVLERKLRVARVELTNDLVALSFGALTVPRSKLHVIQGDKPPRKSGANLAMIAAGTGLGEAGLVWDGARYVALASEGGHADFAPRSAIEWELYEWLSKQHDGHVSYERIAAGPGFSALYDFFVKKKRVKETQANGARIEEARDRNAAIAELGASGKSEPARRAFETFARVYGAEAGNLALKTFSVGGLFVAGNIAARFADALVRHGFVSAFLDKGRFRGMLEAMPIAIVLDTDIGLAGSRLQASIDLEAATAKRET